MADKIRRNDEVVVISGRDKGKRGKVRAVIKNRKAIVSGINIVKKHQKPIPSTGEKGGILEKELAIDISNVAVFNTVAGKADRVGFRFEEGKKVRFFKSNGRKVG